MNKYFRKDGCFTSDGAKKFGFKKGNKYGKNTSGSNHGNWKGGIKYFTSRGKKYRWLRIGIGKYQAEHRLVMEKHLGRKLDKTEAVHHIDGDTLNNNIDNLELLSWGDHKRKHMGAYLYKNGFKCKCGKTKHHAKGMCKKCYDCNYHLTHKNV